VNLHLKARIIERYRTQADFARLCGIREERLSRFITGRSVPKEHEREIICQKLGVAADEIFQAG
jgi:transcriptional regulator with XRE-family HTH domain